MNAATHKALSDMFPRQKGKVASFTDDRIASKMMMMGVCPGAMLEYVRRAPFRGGCYVKAGNVAFALRSNEAQCILIEA